MMRTCVHEREWEANAAGPARASHALEAGGDYLLRIHPVGLVLLTQSDWEGGH
jgi:hypothetical protein